MKRLLLTALLSVLVFGASAQKKVLKSAEKAFKKDELVEAKTLAEQAAANEETANDPTVYSLLGKISLQKFIASEFTSLTDARASLEHFNKAMSLSDEKGKEDILESPIFSPIDDTKWIAGGEQLGLLDHYLVKIGFEALNAEEYERGYPLVEISYEIKPMVEKAFFVGYGAQNSDDMEKAIEYYLKVTEYDSIYDNKGYSYQVVLQEYTDAERYDEALALVAKAKEEFPDEKNYDNIEVDLLIRANKMDQAISGLQEIVDKGNPTKETYYTLAYLQWNNEDLASAEKTALKAIEIDPNYTDALYVAASAIFNSAAEVMTEANTTMDDDDKYAKLKEQALSRFKEAQPYFEKCLEADANDLYSLRPLSTIYSQLGMNDKSLEMLDRIDKIEGGK